MVQEHNHQNWLSSAVKTVSVVMMQGISCRSKPIAVFNHKVNCSVSFLSLQYNLSCMCIFFKKHITKCLNTDKATFNPLTMLITASDYIMADYGVKGNFTAVNDPTTVPCNVHRISMFTSVRSFNNV